MATITAKWKNWVVQSLLQGKPATQIAATLDENGFCPAVITRMLGSNLKTPFAYRCPPARYRQLMKPAFLEKPSSFKIRALCDSDTLQLYALDNFLSPQQCQEIADLARQKLEPSKVAGATSSTGIRTSTTCELAFLSAPGVSAMEKQIISALELGVGESEVIQAQHYAAGQYYNAHYDFFPPGTPQFREHCQRRGQRTWTCMIYLNDDFTGGHTHFPALDLSVMPRRGMALVWNNLTASGEPNTNSLHVAEPVTRGEKMIVTKWFRDTQ